MKITTLKIPTRVYRSESGQVELEMDDSKKEVVGTETLKQEELSRVPSIAQELGQENERAKSLLKATLLKNEKESNSFLLIKILS